MPSESLLHEQILAGVPAQVLVVDLESRSVVYANYSLRWSLGYPVTVGEVEDLADLMHGDDVALLAQGVGELKASVEASSLEVPLRVRSIDGSWRWLTARAKVLTTTGDGHPAQVVIAAPESAASKVTLSNAEYQEHHDPLTDLLTRDQFLSSLEQVLSAGTTPSTVCVCDIDYFRGINESYGRISGDRVLRAFAEILKRTLRHGDVIARLGPDEFGILFPGASDAQCRQPMERVREQLAGTRFPMSGNIFSVTASIGLAGFPGVGGSEFWLESAQKALREGKRGRR